MHRDIPDSVPEMPTFYQNYSANNHHHRPLIPLSVVDTTCFLPQFSSFNPCSLLLFSYAILHLVHPSFLRAISARVPIHIYTHHSFRYVTFIPPHNMPIPSQPIASHFLSHWRYFHSSSNIFIPNSIHSCHPTHSILTFAFPSHAVFFDPSS
jgi:hypothetical protein